jgi:O-antigen/teichoic acid export membrane protein
VHRLLNAIVVLGMGQAAIVVCGIATVKIFAVIGGPSAVGALSVIRALQQTVSTIGSFGGCTWVVQGIASRAGSPDQAEFMRAAWWLVVIALAVTCGVGLVWGPRAYFVDRGDLGTIFSASTTYWVVLAIAAGILLNFYRSLLLAHMRTGKVTRVNAIVGASSILLAWPAAIAAGKGDYAAAAALVALTLGCGLVAAMGYARNAGITAKPLLMARPPQKATVTTVLRISLPTLVIFAVSTITIFLLRALVVQRFGIEAAGLFDAAWTLSTIGIGLLLTTVSSYLLPATGIEKSEADRAELLESAMRVVILIAVPVIGLVACTKVVLLPLFYASDFVGATEVLRWMLLGEYLKIVGWLLATAAYARGHIRAYAAMEIGWSACILAVSFVLAGTSAALSSVGIAYVIAYVLYLSAWLVYAGRHRFLAVSAGTAITWVCGAALVVVLSAWFWERESLDLASVAVVLATVLIFSVGAARPTERAAISLLMKRLLRRPPLGQPGK